MRCKSLNDENRDHPAAASHSVPARRRDSVDFSALGIEADDAATEVESIGQEGIAASNSRSVLATINRYAFDREAVL